MTEKQKPTVGELEKMLDETGLKTTILPSGELHAEPATAEDYDSLKQENLLLKREIDRLHDRLRGISQLAAGQIDPLKS